MALFSVAVLASFEALAASFVVSNTNDAGGGSLRQAIIDATASGDPTDTITFSVAGTITLLSGLPSLSKGGTTIDGGGTVTLDGISAGPSVRGLDIRSANNVVKGLTIVRFTLNGIELSGGGATGNTVSGCMIGTDGMADLGNTFNGVAIVFSASNNTIGGSTPGERNVISGNNAGGIFIEGIGTTGNVVLGNYIGTDAAGTSALGNSLGVSIAFSASNNTIGGSTAGERNVISGNDFQGVSIAGSSATGNVVSGNYIGTDVNGTSALGNDFSGVLIFGGATNNTIGGSTAGERNVISGNGSEGIGIDGIGTTGNVVSGNYIGTDVNGTSALGNAFRGVAIFGGATNNTIGGSTAGERNVISGNGLDGIVIGDSGTTGNVIKGNYIGTDVDGTSALGNLRRGVHIALSASGNTIGGTGAGEGNLISGNGDDGIRLEGPATLTNTISRNSIFDNAAIGITLFGGANGGIAAPAITALGSVDGTAPANSTVEIFVDSADEGETYLDTVVADGAGDFQSVVDLSPHVGKFVTATATDASGNTSRFSAPFLVDLTPPTADTIVPSTTGPTNAASVTFTVTFSESVLNFNDAADLIVSHSGTASTGVSISGGPAVYTASVTGISGDGSFTVAVSTVSDVRDVTGNGLASSVTSAAVSIDNTPPAVAVSGPSAASTNTGPVTYTAIYAGADAVTLAVGDITLNPTGDAAGTVGVSGTGSAQRTVTISGITGNGTLGITIASGTASDTAGNIEGAGGTSATFNVVNNRAPVLDPIGDRQVAEGALLAFIVTASDADMDTLTFAASNLPPGAAFDTMTNRFTWIPSPADVGTFMNVVFTVTDDDASPLNDSETIAITVTAAIELLCDAMPLIFTQMDTFPATFGLVTDDFDVDLIPELAALELVGAATCNSTLDGLAIAAQVAYDVNLMVFDAEAQGASVVGFRELIAALMLVGPGTETELKTILANNGTVLTGNYENVVCLDVGCLPTRIEGVSVRDEYLVFDESLSPEERVQRAVTDPYTASGDPDGDSLANLVEFDNTIANGGTFLDYALAAIDASSDGTSPVSLRGAGGGGGSCFIATAAYGTPLAGELGTLRAFRDRFLLSHAPGSAFVDGYYRLSPSAADFIAQRPALRSVVRTGLAPVVFLTEIALGIGNFAWLLLGCIALLAFGCLFTPRGSPIRKG